MSGYDDLTVMGTAPKVMGTATEVKPTTAALAAALHKTDIPDEIVDGDHWADSEWCIDIENEWAAAILAALPPDWCGHDAEIAHLNGVILRQHDCDHSDCIDREERLRAIEEAARDAVRALPAQAPYDALRAALGAER